VGTQISHVDGVRLPLLGGINDCSPLESLVARRLCDLPPTVPRGPWHESGCGIRQQRKYIEEATTAIDVIHPLAAIVPRDQYENEPYIDDLDDLTEPTP
jgi:hypothetical protein